jgi:hypothetical protein
VRERLADDRPLWIDRAALCGYAIKVDAKCDERDTHDAQGVDRSQIRAMLELSPLERLRRLEAFIASTLEIRALNERTPLR